MQDTIRRTELRGCGHLVGCPTLFNISTRIFLKPTSCKGGIPATTGVRAFFSDFYLFLRFLDSLFFFCSPLAHHVLHVYLLFIIDDFFFFFCCAPFMDYIMLAHSCIMCSYIYIYIYIYRQWQFLQSLTQALFLLLHVCTESQFSYSEFVK